MADFREQANNIKSSQTVRARSSSSVVEKFGSNATKPTEDEGELFLKSPLLLLKRLPATKKAALKL